MRLTNKKICMLLDIATLVAVSALVYFMMGSGPKIHFDIDRGQYPVKGIDISAHNGKIDFETLKSDTVSFVMIKATEGTDFCDANFNINYTGAHEQGLLTGAYHYFRFETPGDVQASHFLATVSGRTFEMPLAIDVERWGNNTTFDAEKVSGELRRMVDRVIEAGYPVMIYTNKKDYSTFIAGKFDDVPLWICSLSAQPPQHDWTCWQHSHNGHINATKSAVDLNTYNGNNATMALNCQPYTVNSQ